MLLLLLLGCCWLGRLGLRRVFGMLGLRLCKRGAGLGASEGLRGGSGALEKALLLGKLPRAGAGFAGRVSLVGGTGASLGAKMLEGWADCCKGRPWVLGSCGAAAAAAAAGSALPLASAAAGLGKVGDAW